MKMYSISISKQENMLHHSDDVFINHFPFQIKTHNVEKVDTAQNLNIENSPAVHCSRKQENKISRFSSNICKTLQFCSC